MLLYDALWGMFLTLLVSAGIAISRLVKVRYLSRKIVHIFVGIAGLFVPFVFSSLIVPLTICLAYAIAIFHFRRAGRLEWMEIEGSSGEIYFALMLPLLLAATWSFDIWLGVTVLSYMAFGDGITGFVRYYRVGHRGKHVAGSIAMLLTSTLLGGAIYGYAHGFSGMVSGVVGGIAATIAERFELVDDNVSIPAVSLPIIVLAKLALGF